MPPTLAAAVLYGTADPGRLGGWDIRARWFGSSSAPRRDSATSAARSFYLVSI